jgi:hypothetical protein
MLSGVYRFPAMESVIFGKRFDEALAQEIDRIDARAVFILASGTLSRTTDTVDRLRHMLGNRCAGVCAKMRRVCARSRSRRHCRLVNTRRRPAAPTPRAMSKKATAIR